MGCDLSGWNARLNNLRGRLAIKAQTVSQCESLEEVVLELANRCCLAGSYTLCVLGGTLRQGTGLKPLMVYQPEKEAMGCVLN